MTRVTLHVRVWIEIVTPRYFFEILQVTLHVRVWIEIHIRHVLQYQSIVTLHARVWIEIVCAFPFRAYMKSHPPREGVD